MVTIPSGSPYPASNIVVLSSNVRQSIPSKKHLTGSSASCEGYLYKAVLGIISGSINANSGSLMIAYSYDGARWNYYPTSATLSSSMASGNHWYLISYSNPVPYLRGLLWNGSGSAASGSIYVIGYKDK